VYREVSGGATPWRIRFGQRRHITGVSHEEQRKVLVPAFAEPTFKVGHWLNYSDWRTPFPFSK
jgi:hypothetical protein